MHNKHQINVYIVGFDGPKPNNINNLVSIRNWVLWFNRQICFLPNGCFGYSGQEKVQQSTHEGMSFEVEIFLQVEV